MTYRFSSPAAVFFSQHTNESATESHKLSHRAIDTLIVGSGYGAAMAALALSEKNTDKKERIVVLERGDEYLPEDFPRSVEDIFPNVGIRGKRPEELTAVDISEDKTKNRLRELWDVRYGDGAITITGSGLGGTSLVNASVVLRPEKHVFNNWPLEHKQTPWQDRLEQLYPKIEQILGVEPTPDVNRFAKYRALKNTVQQLDGSANVEPAPVSIDFNATSDYSVQHDKCNYCGNCVTGCHSGAKQSLNLNAWPLAVQLGTEIFTGVTVNRLERTPTKTTSDAHQWTIYVRKTSNPQEEIAITAKRVILAAGTLGSSSILHRSSTLSLSKKLGKKFSVNGDTVKFGVGQEKRVNAVADAPELDSNDPPGPTITGVGRVRLDNSANAQRIIVEDGAMPFALSHAWNEMLAIQSLISNYAGQRQSSWHKQHPSHDSLAVSNELADHSQVFLTMGRDKGIGELIPDTKQGSSDVDILNETELLPFWDGESDNYHDKVDKLFTSANENAYDGGVSQPNPAWQLIPPSMSSMIAGADDLPSYVVSVHPIGGCTMGLDNTTGVVNCRGQVFQLGKDDFTAVYNDLYVLDAAIIPTAIGANPLLTISALSYALASEINRDKNTQSQNRITAPFPILDKALRWMPPRTRKPAVPRKEVRTEAIFRERLFWDLNKDVRVKASLVHRLQTLFGVDAVPDDTQVAILDINFVFDRNKKNEDTSLEAWVEKPNVALSAEASLRVSSAPLLHTSEDIVVPDDPIAEFSGYVNLGCTSDPDLGQLSRRQIVLEKAKQFVRAGNAIYRYAQFRWLDLFDIGSKQTRTEQVKGYLRFARMHSRWHYLNYQLVTKPSKQHNQQPIRIAGRKTLAYRGNGQTLWDALTILPMHIANDKQGLFAEFAVDLIRIVNGPSPLQVTNESSTPHSIVAIAQLGSYYFRTLLKTHFWSLAALPYKQYPERKEIDDDRTEAPPKTVELYQSEIIGTRRAIYEHDGDLARLVHYSVQNTPDTNPEKVRPTIMFTHGLAHGTRLFWTSDTRENYLQFFLKAGFDVWLLDHRASANYRRRVDNDHTVDDLAEDVSWAVEKIFSITNANIKPGETKRRVHVLAHCVGAAATSLAAFKGDLQQQNDQEQSMLASFSLHAVTPWLFGSAENRARQNIWWFIENSGAVKELDSTMHKDAGAADIVFDRIAHSLMSDDDRRQWKIRDNWKSVKAKGYTRGTYTRYRFFYGPEFNFHNVSRNLKNRFHYHAGITPINSVKQMFLSVVGKRFVNPEAESTYLTEDNLDNFWKFPTLFYHGHDNKVFDIESSRLSAYSLARFRKNKALGKTDIAEEISVEEYNQYGVKLKTLKDYGHMDMIFGEQATNDIGPDILNFLLAAEDEYHCSQDTGTKEYQVFCSRINGTQKHPTEELPISSRIPERLPSAGPVISHVTNDSLRLWAESDDYDTQQLDAITINSINGPIQKSVLRMPGEHDSVNLGKGRFWLYELNNLDKLSGPLGISTTYPSNAIDATAIKQWLEKTPLLEEPPLYSQQNQPKYKSYTTRFSQMPWFQREFSDQPQNHQADLSVAIGSCLHPGTPFERNKSDSIFKGIWQHAIGAPLGTDATAGAASQAPLRELDLMLLLGDQIYADATAELFDSKDYYERYRKRYRSAWTGTWMRRVMSHLPTHFVMDDHEFHDNFSGEAHQSQRYNIEKAKLEAHNFQVHIPTSQVYKKDSKTLQFWHQFERLGVPIFCFDTRFERSGIRNGSIESLFGSELVQWNGFKDWLEHHRSADVLIFASGSPLCPITKRFVSHPELAHQSDGLLAYSGFLEKMIEHLALHYSDKHIIWLAGDPHFSSTANVRLSANSRSINLTCITASGLYSAIPFANASIHEYTWDKSQTLNLNHVKIDFTQQLLSDAYQQFSRLDLLINSKLINIASYDPNGTPLSEVKTIQLQKVV